MSDGFRERTAGDLRLNPNSDPGEGFRNALSTSLSGLSLLPAASQSGECGLDGMELDAALALACFSREAVLESSGRRRRKRLKGRSPARDVEDSIEKRDLTFVSEDSQAMEATKGEEIILEQISERPPASSNCFSNYLSTSSGRKMRQNQTQVERESRRMHRVLANRESARQTIRRRQALRDDLTKKVSELLLENQNMKMEKEQVIKECMSLENKNKQLKDKLATAIECNTMGSEATLVSPETLSFSHQHPYLKNIKPPFLAGTLPPRPVIAAHSGLFNEESISYKATEPKILLCVPPSAWFCSLFHRMSSSCHFLSGTRKDKEVDPLSVFSKEPAAEHKPSMKEQIQRESFTIHEQAPPTKEKAAEAKSCKLNIDLNFKSEMPEPLFDALNHRSRIHDEPAGNTTVVNTVNKPACGTEAVQVLAEQSAYAGAAAAARRRRKEIIKLKHLC